MRIRSRLFTLIRIFIHLANWWWSRIPDPQYSLSILIRIPSMIAYPYPYPQPDAETTWGRAKIRIQNHVYFTRTVLPGFRIRIDVHQKNVSWSKNCNLHKNSEPFSIFVGLFCPQCGSMRIRIRILIWIRNPAHKYRKKCRIFKFSLDFFFWSRK